VKESVYLYIFADDLQEEIDKRIPKYNIHDRLGTWLIKGTFKKVLDCSPGSKEEYDSLVYQRRDPNTA